MKLSEYLKTTTQKEFADKLHVTQGMVGHWVNHRKHITFPQAIKIEFVTDGQVSIQDIIDEFYSDVIPRFHACIEARKKKPLKGDFSMCTAA